MSSPNLEHLLPPSWKSQVQAWLAEDTPSFDYGGYVVGEAEREAYLLGKGGRPAVLAGSPFVTEIFAQLGCTYVRSCSAKLTIDPVSESNGTLRKGKPLNPSSGLRQYEAKLDIYCWVKGSR